MASFKDKDGNHIEMGLHVFFGCYFNLFRLMAKCGVLENLLLKDHTHTFCNKDGDVRELDFRFFIGDTKIGAPFHGLRAFFTTPQLSTADKLANSLALGTSPIDRHPRTSFLPGHHPPPAPLRRRATTERSATSRHGSGIAPTSGRCTSRAQEPRPPFPSSGRVGFAACTVWKRCMRRTLGRSVARMCNWGLGR